MRALRSLVVLASVAAALALPASAGAAVEVIVQPQGAGHGSIGGTSSLSGSVINCIWNGFASLGPCSDVAFGPTYYTVTASPIEGAVFAGWAGTCPSAPTGAIGNVCSFFVNETAVTLKPTFAIPALAVTKEGVGSGTVASSPAGINCGSTCTSSFAAGASVTLTATAAAGSTFAGWGGACALAPPSGPCTLTANAAEIGVVATFNGPTTAPTSALSVTKTGTGGGSVTSSPSGITCSPTCSASFPNGTKVTLTAAPDDASSLGTWGGACAGATGVTCSVTVSAATSVSLAFSARKTNVEADLIAVRVVRSALGQRVVQVELAADEQVSVRLKLARAATSLATRKIAVFPPGERVLRLIVPQAVAAGTARLTVTVRDGTGGAKTFRRSVQLPKSR